MQSQMLRSTRERTFSYISAYIRKRGFAPSMKEIGEGVGLASLSSVAHQLEKLEDEGRITRDRSIPRSIVIVREEVDIGEPGERSAPVHDVPD